MRLSTKKVFQAKRTASANAPDEYILTPIKNSKGKCS